MDSTLPQNPFTFTPSGVTGDSPVETLGGSV